jgi:hypothetical protein
MLWVGGSPGVAADLVPRSLLVARIPDEPTHEPFVVAVGKHAAIRHMNIGTIVEKFSSSGIGRRWPSQILTFFAAGPFPFWL